jgi:selenocysteine-specific elongation factor
MWAQLYFDEPVAANFQEKVVIRFLSPEETLGGATLYWIVERRLKKGDSKLEVLKTLDSNDLAATIHTLFLFFQAPMTRKEIARRISQAESKIHSILLDEKSFIQHQSNYLNRASFDDLLHDIVSKLENYQQNEPLGKGLSSEDLVAGNRAMGEFVLARALEDGVIKNQGNLWQLSSHPNDLEEAEENMRRGIRAIFEEAAYSSPALSSVKSQLGSKSDLIIQWMIQNGDLVRIDREYYILDTQLEHFITALKSWFKEHQELSVGEFREIIPTSRKYLLPLLNYTERKGILIRVGDVRSWAGEELN